MNPVLILTKSILYEQSFQQELQALNQEVLSSSQLLIDLLEEQSTAKFMEGFSIIFISETVTESDLDRLMPSISSYEAAVVRRVDSLPTQEQENHWTSLGIACWLSKSCSMEALRETLADLQLAKASLSNKGHGLFILKDSESLADYFSYNEQLVIKLLHEASEEVVSREELCKKIWGIANVSAKSQLSALVSRIKQKFLNVGFTGETIHTHWGKGYKLSANFYEQLNAYPYFEKFLE